MVVNREVVIRRGEGPGRGERTDIHVDAVVRNLGSEEYGSVTAIIEAKGNWYRQLFREMEAQLAGRYLRDNHCQYGLYLVGWFSCPQWDAEDRRQKTAIGRDLGKTRKQLDVRASKLSGQGLQVKPLVINTALR